MKKIIAILTVIIAFQGMSIAAVKAKSTTAPTTCTKITASSTLTKDEMKIVKKRMKKLQEQNLKYIEKGFGPYRAAIYDDKGSLVASASDSTKLDKNCLLHAEMNVIRLAQEYYRTPDLTKFNLSIYTTAEPSLMDLAAIQLTGIKNIYFATSYKTLDEINGENKLYRLDWQEDFYKMGINVYPNIMETEGTKALTEYKNREAKEK